MRDTVPVRNVTPPHEGSCSGSEKDSEEIAVRFGGSPPAGVGDEGDLAEEQVRSNSYCGRFERNNGKQADTVRNHFRQA